jgi:hypothetical protein
VQNLTMSIADTYVNKTKACNLHLQVLPLIDVIALFKEIVS